MANNKSKIRWRKSDTAELQRAINNFNARLYSAQKKDPDSAHLLPTRAKKSAVLATISTRADFKRELANLQRGVQKPNTEQTPVKGRIQWRDSDKAELKKAIKNFNAKIVRVQKKDPSMGEFLPDKLKMKDVVSSIKTRNDFKHQLASLKRFTQAGAETPVVSSKGAKFTTWFEDEAKRKEKRVNLAKRRERNKISNKPEKQGGKKTGNTMETVKDNELKEWDSDFRKMSPKEVEKRLRAIDFRLDADWKGKRLEQMRENYIKGLKDQGILNLDPSIEEDIRAMSPEKFYETAQTDREATFFFYKDPQAIEIRTEHIGNVWHSALEEEKQEKEERKAKRKQATKRKRG